ncbi:zinc finger HIT domain-containing protein 3 [Chrysoperla carnea]|uniref:zinc finger HIT domain-containing protein 3 n=1 Tax=Chrysoperla carnea TaxID=189513 RepID=UPI001D082786|nr:zinc finger HIT domain-containing protein 3 [Chrysoperla carnea]
MVNCTVCDQNTGKYKCPVCRAQYCSVPCCKKHKEENCKPNQITEKNETVETTTKESQKKPEFVTEDTVPNELLERLRESKKLKEMFKVSDLKKLLNYVDKSDNPYKDVQTAMRDPLFTEFVDECLKIVDPLQNQQDF